MITKPARRRSLEVTYLYRSRNAGREMTRLWDSFVTSASAEALNKWEQARQTEIRVRRMREIATKVTIARARHSLSLAELRSGRDAYATYAALPPSRGGRDANDLANDKELNAATAIAATANAHETIVSVLDLYLGDDHNSTGPPLYARPHFGDPPT